MVIQHFKLVAVGDTQIGKTALFITYKSGAFPAHYIPIVFDNYSTHKPDMIYKNIPILLSLWDTASKSDYDRLRPLSYPSTHMYLLCFSIDNRSSFENIKYKWLPEIKHHTPKSPFIIVGLKKDLRNEDNKNDKNIISYNEGKKLCKQLNGCGYVECSSKMNIDVDNVFNVAVKYCFEKYVYVNKKNKACVIL